MPKTNWRVVKEAVTSDKRTAPSVPPLPLSKDTFMKQTVIVVGAVAAAIVFFAIVIIGSMYMDRAASKFGEETRTQTYEKSRTYQKGTNLNIAEWCAEMRTHPDHAKALAVLIRQASATYEGPLSADNADCIAEAKLTEIAQ